MFIPIPALIAAGLVFLVLLALAMRSRRRRDPLLGGQPAYRATKPAPVAILSGDVEQQVRALLAAGRKIDAIKLARDTNRLGLREAKDLVEAMGRKAP